MSAIFDRRRIIIALVVALTSIGLLVSLRSTASDTIRLRISQSIGVGTHTPDHIQSQKPETPERYRVGSGYVHPKVTNGTINGKERLAYLTFLTGTGDQIDDLENDKYLQATRVLIWQLLHNPTTRTNGIDVVIMVTPTVGEARRARLKKDGAIVYPVDFLHVENDDWIKAEKPRWADVITKMRAWQMTEYSRILMLDGDTMLRRPLDGIFDDPGAQIRETKQLDNYVPLPGEAPLPSRYLLGGNSEVWDSNHDFPPTFGKGLKGKGYFNAGFFLFHPSDAMFKYFTSLMTIKNSFDPKYPEQNLMNYAHNWTSPMPWTEVSYTWNIRCPNENDFEQGLVSMHEKWWKQPYIYENQKVKDWLRSQRWEMKGWYDAWDLRNS